MKSNTGRLTVTILLLVAVVVLFGCFDNGAEPINSERSVIQLSQVFKQLEFSQPVAMLQVPNNDSEWYVVEKPGQVFRITSSSEKPQKQLYLDIKDRVDDGPSEAGLLGMAFHPKYKKNGEVFVSYTAEGSPLTSTISRFKGPVGDVLPEDSETILLAVEQPYGNHNGGQIAFDPKGNLMIGFGDGGSGGDPKGNGQNVQTLLGAMLRIDVDSASPYAIPNDNPLVGKENARGEIYAWGMRNPWRWSFDRKTGELWVADVGQNKWEEINLVTKPGNYGWNLREATHCYDRSPCPGADFIDPVAEYSHQWGCSVTGGYVYRGKQIPKLKGVYLYGDFCSGRIWGLYRLDNGGFESRLLLESGLMIASFAEDNQGEIYVIHYHGKIYKIVPSKN
ncbi:PQQ-dependent sugar dehydrogenase [Kaarinaea lacus]